MKTALPLAFALVLLACNGTSVPPTRTSPVLVQATTDVAAGAILLDTRDQDPLWVVSSGAFLDRTGQVAGPVPAHATDVARGVRGLPGNEIWACFDTGVAHFVAGSWTFTDWSAFGSTSAPVSCDGLDARTGNDVWVAGSGELCGFDGTTWRCRDLPGQAFHLALTAQHAWLSHETGSGSQEELLVVDTTSASGAIAMLDVGDLVAVGSITPVPGAEQVFLTHDPSAFMNGSTSARLFGVAGLVRTEDAQSVVPVSADEAYLLQILDDTMSHCSGGITGMCTTTTNWSQLVVWHEMGATRTEVAHVTDASGAVGVPSEAILVDGHLVFPGTPTLTLP